MNDPEVEAALNEIIDFAAEQPGVTVTSPYDNPQQISEDGTIAYAQLDISDRGFQEIIDLGTEIEEFGDSRESVAGLEVEYGGDPFSEFELPESEIYGIIAAVIILILAFGSVLAMGLPIGTALFGLGIATALVSLGSNVIDIPDFTTAMVAMIGLGVGIDYALFIVTRYREGLQLGLDVEDSVAESMDTSGRAVLFAGITVIISLMGLFLMGLSFVQGIALAASLGVLMMMLGSLTLLPALLGWIGTRIDHTTRAALGAVALGVAGAFFGVITKQEGDLHLRHARRGRPLRAQLLRQVAAQGDPPPRRAGEGAAPVVPVEPLHPAPAVAAADRGHRCARHPGDPAVRHPPRLRRLRQLPRGQDGTPGVRPAGRGLRSGHQRSAVRHGGGRDRVGSRRARCLRRHDRRHRERRHGVPERRSTTASRW